MTFVTGGDAPTSPLPTWLPAADFEISPSTEPHEGPQWVSVMGKVRAFSSRRGRSKELDRQTAGKHTARLENSGRDFDPEHSDSPYAGGIVPQTRARLTMTWDDVVYALATGYADGWPQTFQGRTKKDAYVDFPFTDVLKLLGRIPLPDSWWDFVMEQDRPTHRWRMDDDAGPVLRDTGFGERLYDLTLSRATLGSDAVVAYDAGRKAAFYNGVFNYAITLAGPLPAGTYSAEGWLRIPPMVAGTVANVPLLWLGPSAGAHYLALGSSANTGKLTFNGIYATAARYDDGLDHHFAYSVSTTSFKLWVDGVLVINAAGVAALTTTGAAYLIVNTNPGGSYGFNIMTMAELCIYDGVVLDDATALRHFEAGSAAFAGSSIGSVIERILDFAGIPAAERNIEDGAGNVGAYELEGDYVLEYVLKLVETERGRFFVDRYGKATFQSRYHPILDERGNTVQATFGKGVGQVPFEDIAFSYEEDDVINVAKVTRRGGAPQTVYASDAKPPKTIQGIEVSGLLFESDVEANDLAYWLVANNKDPRLRVRTIVLDPRANPDVIWPVVLSLEIGDRIALDITPNDVGDPILRELIVEGISVNAPEPTKSSRKVTITIETSPADPFDDYWIFDVSHFDLDTRFAF